MHGYVCTTDVDENYDDGTSWIYFTMYIVRRMLVLNQIHLMFTIHAHTFGFPLINSNLENPLSKPFPI